jgi:putative oxidoreductase
MNPMSIGMLLIRIVVGLLFIGHGTQKLFGWFGGHGRVGTAGFLGSLGYPVPGAAAVFGGVAEAGGGLLLALGLLTPLASAAIIVMMVSAILAVHVRNGLWNTSGGIELPLVYLVVAAAAAFGPGRFSLDHVIGWGWNHRLVAVIALIVGILGGVAVSLTRRTGDTSRGVEPGDPTVPMRSDQAA